MKDQKKAYLYALVTVMSWASVASAVKLSLRWTDPVTLVFSASVVAAGLFLALLVVQKKLSLLGSFTAGQWAASVLYGLFNPCLYYLFLFTGYSLLPAQQAMPINSIWPIVLTLLAIPLLGQKVTGRQWLAIAISFFGVLVIGTRGRPWTLAFTNLPGVALLLASCVVWAFYWILNTRDRREPLVVLSANFFCAVPLLTVYMVATKGREVVTGFNWQGCAGGIWLGFFEMGLPFVCWLTALRLTTSTARIANLIFLAPLLSLLVISVAVPGEKIHPATVVGLGCIVGGLFLERTGKR